ncbi:MAG: hypothetical protein P4N59_14405 [Negativicutes bacterium]|nr:hypothetical protein [Negativicutes bacterium]
MIPTLKLSDIISKWQTALQASQPIQNFCSSTYNKTPSIFVGINGQTPPATDKCPMIILYPGSKKEGLERQEFIYKLTIGWTIVQSATTVSNNVTAFNGVAECDALGQLIYMELAQISTDNPISVVNYNIEPVAYFPQFPGRMDVTVKIKAVNGYSITY